MGLNQDGISIFGSSDNIIIENIIVNTNCSAVYIEEDAGNNYLSSNTFCGISWDYGCYNIYNFNETNYGDDNLCNITYGWADSGVSDGCKYDCMISECVCYDCESCILSLGSSDCFRVTLINDIDNVSGKCIDGNNAYLQGNRFSYKLFDCDGHYIRGDDYGNGEMGIYLYQDTLNHIFNCNISNFDEGIGIYASNFNYIYNNIINENNLGIVISGSSYMQIYGNNITNSESYGLSTYNSYDNAIELNYIANSGDYGVIFWDNAGETERRSTFYNNIVLLNKGGVYLYTNDVNIVYMVQNIICRNAEKDPNRYDIFSDFYASNFGTLNYCDYVLGWTDYNETGHFVDGCLFECAGEYESVNVSEEVEKRIEIRDMFESVNIVIEGLGFRSYESKNLFVIIFIVVIDFIFILRNVNVLGIIIVDIFLLLIFAYIGWLEFWIVLLFIVVSAFIFAMGMRKTITS